MAGKIFDKRPRKARKDTGLRGTGNAIRGRRRSIDDAVDSAQTGRPAKKPKGN